MDDSTIIFKALLLQLRDHVAFLASAIRVYCTLDTQEMGPEGVSNSTASSPGIN